MDHRYYITIEWTGNRGAGTSGYTTYDRSHLIKTEHKADIEASSDPHFRGDASKHNPEDLFLASVASCHMLWYLHLCADNGVVVDDYSDQASGLMETTGNGSGKFTRIILNPCVTVSDTGMEALATLLHHKAHEMCFLANSVNFEIRVEPRTNVKL